MKLFKVLLVLAVAPLVALPACTGNPPLSYQFRDTSDALYSSSHLSSDFKKNYGIAYNPAIVMVQSETMSDPKFKAQDDILINIEDVEERGIIFVGYCADGMYREGYYIASDEKPIFFADNGFHVYLISPEGRLVQESSEPLSAEQIKAVFPHRSSVQSE